MKTRSPGTTWSLWTVIVGAMLFPPSEARSQEQPTVAPLIMVGSKIRLMAPTVLTERIDGMVTQMDEDSLVVGTLRVPRQAITQLEVSTGRRGRALKGMLIGAAIGGVAGAGMDALLKESGVGGTPTDTAAIVGVSALSGAAWGALIGHFVKTDRWSSVPPERVRVSLAPARGRGAGLSLSIGW